MKSTPPSLEIKIYEYANVTAEHVSYFNVKYILSL